MTDHVFIIAEAGVNHNGDLNRALEMVDVAADAGADAVKFQTFKAEKLVSKTAKKAEYQTKNTGVEETQFEMLKKIELRYEDHQLLMERCQARGINFMSTAFDEESVELLNHLGMEVWKIPSGEITNLPYLRQISAVAKSIILSTGMSSLEEIEAALGVLRTSLNRPISVLHCTTEYPTPMGDVNLLAMLQMREKFNVEVGYSDHTLGIEVPIAAVALGAKIIEKHFTLDKALPGPDHRASADPLELNAMVSAIRNIEVALGNGEKRITESEQKNLAV
ncbi:N-acetylneuraminate synthase, partial [Myxococcota bacterium]|nr:N-acetylneuraminate synthase [Myxococcota bacterium]